MTEQRKNILIADDDLSLSTVLADYLRGKDYLVDTVRSGDEALEAMRKGNYNACVMDVKLPEMNGFEVLAELRKAYNWTPVIFLTERNSREDIIRGFNLGCDDYMTKPFSMDILICRLEAIIRRTVGQNQSKETVFDLGKGVFDATRQTLGDEHLSARESDLLLMLCQNKGQVVDRHIILCTLWQTDDFFSSRSLSVYINHLRHFLEGSKVRIIGVHGKGYKLVED